MKISQELKEALAKAKANVATTRKAYNDAWRKDPTAKGYPEVDKRLAALQEAERELRTLEDQAAEIAKR